MTWWGRYIGVPFRDGGRSIDGLDCWGLVRLVYAEHLDVTLPSYGEISARDLIRVARSIGAGQDGWHQVKNPRPFDVAVMRLHDRSWVGHVGVMADATHVLHTEAKTDAVVVPVDHYTVRHRIAGYRRLA